MGKANPETLCLRLWRQYWGLPDFLQNISFVFFTQFIVLAAGTLANIILARSLGPEGKGIIYLIVLVAQTLFIFASLGVSNAVVYFVAKKQYSPTQIASNSLSLAFLISVIFGILYYIFLPGITQLFLKHIDLKFLHLAFALFVIMIFTAYLGSIPHGLQKIKQASSVYILQTVSRLGFIIVLVVFLKMNVAGALMATVASFLVGLVLAVFLVLKVTTIGFAINFKIIKELIAFGVKNQIGAVAQFLNYRFDAFLVKLFLSTASVGLYSVSVLLAELVGYIPNAVSLVLFPKVADSDSQTGQRLTPQVCRHGLFLTVCMAVMFFS